MSIWKKPLTLTGINAVHAGTAMQHLGIEITEIGADFIRGRVPVDSRTVQPLGILHGGINVVLAETLGSLAAWYACEADQMALGLDINANHLRPASSGWVTGTARPVHIGRKTHVWNIDMVDERGRPTCVSRLTMAVMPMPHDVAEFLASGRAPVDSGLRG